MKLSRFDGGLSTRLDPSLISINEAVKYLNIENEKSIIQSVKDYTLLTTVVSGFFYFYLNKWISSSAERSYVEYKNFLYSTEKNKRPLKDNGNRESLLGIASPLSKITPIQADPVDDEKISDEEVVVQYTYTYYNKQEGIESAPAPISDELTLEPNKVVDLKDFTFSSDNQVDYIRIYRLGANTTTMTLAREYKVADIVGDTIRDDVPTLDLIGTLLETYDNQPPPLGLQFLTEAYGIMFGILEDKLYYSKIGQPDYWPAAQYIDLPRNGVGLLPVPNGILVFQENTTDILVGTSSADFRMLPVSREQGSISHYSGAIVKSVPIWLSKSGFCVYTGGFVQVISNDKLGKVNLSIVNTAVHNEVYYVVLTDGTLLALDLRFGACFKEFKFDKKVDNIHVSNDVIYVRFVDTLATLFTGDLIEFTYKSPVLTEEEHSVNKSYNNIYIRSDGDIEVIVYIDGENVLVKPLSGNLVHDITPPQEEQDGTSIQFLIKGIGKVYEIEYKVLGRENGR